MDRTILHSDMNSCYASIELLHHPELRGKPMAVGGDPELRHGIVLAKTQEAKKCGVKTGMALWEAKRCCPDIVFIPPHYDRYMRFSRLAHEIYGEYSDVQEAFGIDESWIDISESLSVTGGGRRVAEEIRERMKRELGVTVSIGISWNKIFAKFGSDYRKPDAVTEITRENYRTVLWNSPAEDLLYVGPATKRKLNSYGIRTIGALAEADPAFLRKILGKMGLVLHLFANGEDRTPVAKEHREAPVKSVGNGMTAPRDLVTDEDVRIVLRLLAESVGARLREQHLAGYVVETDVRDTELFGFSRQHRIDHPTDVTEEIAKEAIRIFRQNYGWAKPVRSLTVRVSALVPADTAYQISLFEDPFRREKQQKMDRAVDSIRERFGYHAVQRGLMLRDSALSSLDAKNDNTIHPVGYFDRGNRTGWEALER